MKKHLLLLFAALLPLVASAQKVEIDGIWYNLVAKAKQAEVTSPDGTGYSGSITIPATVTYDGVSYSVTSIGTGAFSNCSSLTAITLPESVTSIGEDAFWTCSSLTAVYISDIAAWCSIKFLSNPLAYAHNLYLNGELVTELVIPEGVTSIGGSAFSGCSSLTAITLPESVTSIGYGTFQNCSGLTTITIPENSQLTSIGEYAFYYCSSLTTINIPEGVTSIERCTFYGCSSLTAITLPEGVTSIGMYAFYYCRSLTAINIPEGVTSIGYYACEDCSSLTTVVLPKSVSRIYSEAFAGCSELTDVYCYAESVPNTDADAFDGSYPDYATLHVPAVALNDYKSTVPWSSFGTINSATNEPIQSITLSQSSATLLKGASLTLTATVAPDNATDNSVTWSSSNPSVATVDNTGKVTAFAIGTATITATANDGSGVNAQCVVTVASTAKVEIDGIWYNLVSKAKQAEVTFKGDDPYQGGWYSGSITLPATVTYGGVAYSVTSIGGEAFLGCSRLKSITLPEGVTSIGSHAFSHCSSLTAITLPEGVTSIGDNAFSYCSSLTAINIPASVTSIGDGAFGDCSSLTAITIPEGVTSIGSHAFSNCSSLTAITLPEGVTSIGNWAFYGCSNLTAINIPKGVTSTGIGKQAFSGCSSLTAIVLPKNVKWINNEAFAGCPELTDVYCYAESVPNTDADAFDGSYPEYATLHVPASAINSYKGTAPWSSFGTIVSLTDEKVTDIILSQSTATLTEGRSLILIATIEPGYATNKAVTWSSTDLSVAAVDNNGKVTAIAPGTATITATANDGSGVSAQCEVTVTRTAKVEIDGIWYNLITKAKQAEVTYKGDSYDSYSGEYSGSITIPATVTYDGVAYSVTSIGESAFYYCSSLTAITIPEGVTSIGDDAFYSCGSLTAITLPESVTSIGRSAFAFCSILTDIICKAVTPPTPHSRAFLDVKKSIPIYVPAASVDAYKKAEGWKEFINIVPIEDEKELTLIDGENFAQNKDVEYESITYTRTFNNTNWQALYVPFEIPYGAIGEDFDVAYIYDARQYDRDNDGTKDEIVIEAFKISEGVLEANYPYVIRAKETGEKSITVTDATLYATEENSIDCSSVYDTYTFTGTYSSLSSDELTGCYALSGGMWQPVLEGTSLGAFRFYLKIDSRHGNTIPTQAIKMRIVDEDGNTSTEKLELKTQNSEQIFDLQGRRVESPTKGIYIINGKKVVIK